MDISKFFDQNEKPLDNSVTNGGFCGIFRTIGCIGDSLSSGEFESCTDDGITGWHDMYDYSWGQYLARDAGCKVYNFSRGGMNCRCFMESFGESCGAWSEICPAYIIALGVNDIGDVKRGIIKLGTADDIGNSSNDTFVGAYANIIINLKRRQPDARFFLMTIPTETSETDEDKRLRDGHAELLYTIAEKYKNCYILDFRKYAPVYDEEFKKRFFLRGHMNPMGYMLTARMVESYIDYIIRHNTEDFKQIGFIGTPHYQR